MPPVHRTAALGFGRQAAVYERARPTYPPAAVAHLTEALGLGAGSAAMDLAAGTGKLTRLLAPSLGRTVAVEPVAGMRARLRAALPSVEVVAATAESLPFAAASFDAVLVAQAFHWFDPAAAVREIARVLRVGGGLGMVWNVRDESVDWVARFSALLAPHRGNTPTARAAASTGMHTVWRPAFDAASPFPPLAERVFAHEQPLDAEGLVQRTLSISFVATLDEPVRAHLVAQVRDLARTHPDLAGRRDFSLPYRTHVLTTRLR